MLADNRARPLAEINMVPFIDVLLVLLVIVLITAPMVTQPIPIALPRTAALSASGAGAAVSPSRPILHLAIDAQQQLYRDGVPMATANVATDLARAALADPALRVHVHAQRSTPYEAVAQLMAQLAQAGLHDIGLVTTQALPSPSNLHSQPKDPQ